MLLLPNGGVLKANNDLQAVSVLFPSCFFEKNKIFYKSSLLTNFFLLHISL